MQSNNADNPIKKRKTDPKYPLAITIWNCTLFPIKQVTIKPQKAKKKATIKNSIGSALFATQQMNISAS